TPALIRGQILKLLEDTSEDLPDMTPRRFLRHPILRSFLKKLLPTVINPTLADWHVSLANRSHLKAYIIHAREMRWPFGTDWAGLLHLKEYQDTHIPKEYRYIRHEDEDVLKSRDSLLRIAVCMFPESNRRLNDEVKESGQYIQSDIAFQRVVGYEEFELAGMDRDANSSIVFVRAYVNRQSAYAHKLLFQLINDVVQEDTGKGIQWRHLYAKDDLDFKGWILTLSTDQHRGQALGFGQQLVELAATLPIKADLHEPTKTIQELTPYDHLARCLIICNTHIKKRIKIAKVSPACKQLMRSLMCLEHQDWDGTLQAICDVGGKVGQDWVKDKVSSRFIFPGICQALSFIPLPIWCAVERTTNVVEQVHQNVNLEGTQNTLVGAALKGHSFDI
ncbi:hypothetical protein C8J57DRAFT_971869, partial [Mycena rebaudengoi]